ncbi:zinc/manganese transport system substrate-binding protein [Methanomicrobium sp. W14]|uniref:metal ABC transporter substrate-binding protein n=1 Tax=Methanomicrobium sp. W14 TaxID=2817839 RepID=UPI001AE24D48|nr:metal ABC transporter substrate-binding protein [Methanomicrobium sp. W14]MBP2134373.1 zinc/manganese transport system substrate-binding protein [Methanomicrobium sp. W14]
MNFKAVFFGLLVVLLVFAPSCSALNIVSTTSVLWDPLQSIGGEYVNVTYIADPAICPHMQGDIIPNRIQMQMDFIESADMFVAHNSSVDKEYVMPYLDKFMEANGFGKIKWTTLKDPDMSWNTPDKAKALAEETESWLVEADPEHKDYYDANLEDYIKEIYEKGNLTQEEKNTIPGQKAVVMIWQKDAAQNWLGLDIVDIFAPDFYMGGNYTAAKLVDSINENPNDYRDVSYVVENMQSGEIAKGVEEALTDLGYNSKRVVFTNFPRSIDGVDSIPDVLAYNKNLVNPGSVPAGNGSVTSAQTRPVSTATKSPGFSGILALTGVLSTLVIFKRRFN